MGGASWLPRAARTSRRCAGSGCRRRSPPGLRSTHGGWPAHRSLGDHPIAPRTDGRTPLRVELTSSPTTPEPARAPRYPPLEHFFGPSATFGAQSRRGGLTPPRFIARMRRDAIFLLAIAIALPVLAMEALTGEEPRLVAVAFPVGFAAVQLGLAVLPRVPSWWPLVRL